MPIINVLNAASVDVSVPRTVELMANTPVANRAVLVDAMTKLVVDGNPRITVELNCVNCPFMVEPNTVEKVDKIRVFADMTVAKTEVVVEIIPMDEFCKILNVV